MFPSCFILVYRFHIKHERFSEEERNTINEKALHVFVNRAPMQKYNQRKLFEVNNRENPVARIVSQTTRGKGRVNHFDEERGLQNVLYLARKCRVEIRGRNIRPDWGLFNGSMGTIEDIVYLKGEKPATHFPAYVLVDFPLYCGPIIDPSRPTCVPITTTEIECQYQCCRRKQIPLGLAFGKTLHTMQGANVGKAKPGQAKNAFEYGMFNLGGERTEERFTGATYTALSRATTLGNDSDNLSSALYFFGEYCPPCRFQHINISKTGKIYKRYQDRARWINYLHRNTKTNKFSEKQKKDIDNWYCTNPISAYELDKIIQKKTFHG